MNFKRITASLMALAIVGGTMPYVSDIAFKGAVTANAAETTAVDVLPSMKTVSYKNTYGYAGDKDSSFKMNGRTYYQGFVMTKGYSSDDSNVSVDVSGINTLSWTMSHIDGSNRNDAKLNIYIDDVLTDTVQLTWKMKEYKYEKLDVSKGKVLRFELESNGGCKYGLGDITSDKEKPAMLSVSPEHTNVGNVLSSAFDYYNYSYYQGINKVDCFNMNGRSYYQGIVLSSGYSGDNGFASFNVEGLKKMTFTMGHIDGSNRNSAKLNIYIDDELMDVRKLITYMPLEECEINIPDDAKLLRLELVTEGGCKYGFGDVRIDSLEYGAEKSIPKFAKTSTFIESGFNVTNVTKYSGISKGTNFNVNGRTYYQGITFKSGYSGDNGIISFNVENINKLGFDFARVVDSGTGSATLHIYKDNVEYEKLPLKPYMSVDHYDLDVKDAKNVRFWLESEGQSSYAMMNINIDDLKQEIDYAYPKYEKISNLTDKVFDNYSCSVYSGISKAESYNMMGRTYYEGVVLSGDYSGYNSSIRMNVEDIDSISWTVGHLDNSGYGNATMNVYLDEVLIDKIDVKWSMLPTLKTYDVKDGTVLRVAVVDRDAGSKYGLGDIKADTRKTATDHAVPTFDSAKAFLDSAYDSGAVTIYNGDSPKINKYSMSGKEYTQGIIVKANYSGNTAYASFNTENVSSLKFTLGHVDETKEGGGTLTIYKDGAKAEEFTLKANAEVEDYTIDTSGASYVRVYFEANGGCSYALANVAVTAGSAPQTTTATTAASTTTTTTTATTSKSTAASTTTTAKTTTDRKSVV